MLDTRIADAMLLQGFRGLEEIVVGRPVASCRARDCFHHHLEWDGAGVTRAPAVHREGERADGLVADAAVEPLRPVRPVEHLALPDELHLLLHEVRRDAVDDAAAAAAALEREHQARTLRCAAIDARPNAEGPVVASGCREIARV